MTLHTTRSTTNILLTLAVSLLPLSSQAADRSRPAGDVIVIPQEAPLSGNLRAMGHSLKGVIDGLEHRDVKACMTHWESMVAEYLVCADKIGQAQEGLGRIETQLLLVEQGLQNIDARRDIDPQEQKLLLENLAALRSQLVGRLKALRARLAEATDDQERKKLLQQLAALVARTRQYDQTHAALDSGTGPIVPGFAIERTREQIDAMQQALRDEQQAMEVTVNTTRLLVRTSARQMSRTLSLLELHQQIPQQEFSQLRQTQSSLQTSLKDLDAAHRPLSEAILNIMTGGVDPGPVDEESLMKDVADILGEPMQP